MYRLTRPTEPHIQAFASARREGELFPVEGGIPEIAPPGFGRNAIRGEVGRGAEAFAAAREALRRWEQFPAAWIAVVPEGTPVEPGAVAVVRARLLGIYTLNACRVVEVEEVDEPSRRRFAFTYATVPDHAMRGAEIFAVEWDRASDLVHYELASISRPRELLAWLVLPYVRWMQRSFARDSLAAMRSAVQRRTRR